MVITFLLEQTWLFVSLCIVIKYNVSIMLIQLVTFNMYKLFIIIPYYFNIYRIYSNTSSLIPDIDNLHILFFPQSEVHQFDQFYQLYWLSQSVIVSCFSDSFSLISTLTFIIFFHWFALSLIHFLVSYGGNLRSLI